MNEFDFIKYSVESSLLSRLPLPSLLNVNVIIPYYHIINDEDVIHTKHLYPHKSILQFKNDIDHLIKHYRPIHFSDLLEYVKTGHPLPPKALLLSFDDGFREMYDVVMPILIRKGVPAVFFISSSFTDNCNLCFQHKASIVVEHIMHRSISEASKEKIAETVCLNKMQRTSISDRILEIKYDERDLIDKAAEILEIDFQHYLHKHNPYLNKDQIFMMISSGFAIGGHSIDHPLYRNLPQDEQIKQTMDSVEFVKNTFHLNYGTFAFPHTDNGVSRRYFMKIEESGLVDISFGTSGIIEDVLPYHFQRFSLEKPLLPAKNILAYQYARKFWRNIRKNAVINRD